MQNTFAHSVALQPANSWQTLRQHSLNVARLARSLAEKFGAGSLAEIAGLLHDIGKHSDEFQRKLNGAAIRVDHSTAGARIAADRYRQFAPLNQLIAYAIAGHHAGLANWAGDSRPLKDRLDATKYSIPAIDGWEHGISPPASAEIPALVPNSDPKVSSQRAGLCLSTLTRMIFSALVDADRLDTEDFYNEAEGRQPSQRGHWRPLPELKRALDQFMDKKAADAAQLTESQGQSSVNIERAKILAAARQRAMDAQGLFSLTVPTGGGKTLASLTFALDHAAKYELDRVIYVIPFTSIIEQTAKVFRDALGPDLAGHIIEHHSAFREDEALDAMQSALGQTGDESSLQAGQRMRLATENWDAPIIVTTAVQFFESLFSNRPSRCRKLHNIARSVVILDEAQTLPLTLLRPCVAMLDELARNYKTSIVLCTATQPALEATRPDGRKGLDGGLIGVREIVGDSKRLYEAMQRVTVKPPCKITDDELVQRLAQHQQVLCIVGTRSHARELFDALKQTTPDHVFHLSALMCPAHRSAKLAEIKASLKAGSCRVVATTVIEAGVDIDFPVVYRAMAGLDSIAQAAGRCNREGRRTAEESIVQLFEIEGRKPIRELRANEEVAREVLRRHGADPLSLAAIEAYFDQLYWRKTQGREDDGLDKHGIIANLNVQARDGWLPFEDVARDFQMIDSAMEPVIIPYDDDAKKFIAELERTDDVRTVARKLQPYIVNVPRTKFAELRQAGSIQPAYPLRYDEQFVVLSVASLYSHDFGLDWNDPSKRASEDNLF
jgi:CRISPR-associated endonuclease/helicase Cas3